jgi:hypothetical protein
VCFGWFVGWSVHSVWFGSVLLGWVDWLGSGWMVGSVK